MYTVKEVASELQLTPHAIRYYTDQELIPHVFRDKNNNRLFDEEAKLWLKNVKYMRNCGMSIHDIKQYVDLTNEGPATIAERFKILMKQKKIIHEKMKELQESGHYLDRKIEYYTEQFMDGSVEKVAKQRAVEELSAGI